MAKTTHGHQLDGRGRVQVTSSRLPKGMRRVDPEYDVHTFTEGPLARLFNRRTR